MKKVEQMTLDEMLNAGMTVEQIDAAIKERMSTREKENAEAAANEQRKAEIEAARRQYKKAHAKYMKAVTGQDMTAEEMAEFESCVCLSIEKMWEIAHTPKKVKIKADDLDDLAAVVIKALG